jgi:hypothetical protein
MHPDLIREIDDLYDHYVIPVFCEWVLRQGALIFGPLGSITINLSLHFL